MSCVHVVVNVLKSKKLPNTSNLMYQETAQIPVLLITVQVQLDLVHFNIYGVPTACRALC